jgi:D-alanyl-D-alanine carboxypeptidase/D-alanyl-D-alanine-endopeptidase (penicillin-binding protein 4)
VNRVTQRGGTGGAVTVRRRGDNELDVSGWIGTHSGPRKYSIVVNDPPRFAAGALRASLAAAGITVDGAIREGITPAGATVVASNQSPPLARIVSDMNRESINHLAELLFRDAARASSPTHTGSALTGETALHQFLEQKVGVPPSAVTVSDGSGLSVRDSVTARALVDLLSYANRAPWSSAFHASLPVAGESELLRKRMKRTPAQGNLHAKTGTTNTVAALSGYVTAEDGEILAFAFIYNGADRWNAKDAMDRAGATLASFSRN